MEMMGRNRVVRYGEVDFLNEEATNALSTGYVLCGEWDQIIENLKGTMGAIRDTVSGEYVSTSLESAINGISTPMKKEKYQTQADTVKRNLTKLTNRYERVDAEAGKAIDLDTQSIQYCAAMFEDLRQYVQNVFDGCEVTEFKERMKEYDARWEGYEQGLQKSLEHAEALGRDIQNYMVYDADPVNMSTGNFVYQQEDIRISGTPPFVYHRTYNAMDNGKGVLGRCWIHNYEGYIQEEQDMLFRYHEDGRKERFHEQGDHYVSDGNEAHYIKKQDGWYCFIKEESEYQIYDAKGRLRMIGTNECVIVLTYQGEQLIRVQNNRGEEFCFSYQDGGLLQEVTDHGGRRIKYIYEENRLIKVTDSDGTQTGYDYGENGRIEKITDKRGVCIVENEYDQYRRIQSQKFPDGGCIKIAYAQEKKEVRYENQKGAVTRYIHDQNCRNVLTGREGKDERKRYNEKGQCIQKCDYNGNLTTYEYDKYGRLQREKDSLLYETKYQYDEKNSSIRIIDKDGSETLHEYDKLGRKVSEENGLGHRTVFQYEGNKRRPEKIIMPDGSVTTLCYDTRGNITKIKHGEEGALTYQYDHYNRVIESGDGNGNCTKYSYDSRNRLIKVTRPDNAVKEYQYNGMGEAKKIIDFDRFTTQWEYNEINKPIRYTDKEGRTTSLSYDSVWNVASITDPEGRTECYEYDNRNCLRELKMKSGETIRFTYDANHNRTGIEYPDHTSKEYGYDEKNRLIWEKDQKGNVKKYDYDAKDRQILIEDALGNQTEFCYDKIGNLIRKKTPSGAITKYRYDEMSRIKEIHLDSGQTQRYRYGASGFLERYEKGDGIQFHYQYDKAGNLIQETDQNQNRREYRYNCLNQVMEVVYNGNREKSFDYDEMGRIKEITDGLGAITKYRYSPQGNLILMQDALGTCTMYEYNGCDELTGIVRSDKKEALPNQYIHFQRNPYGLIEQIEEENGRQDFYTYDLMGRVRTCRKENKTQGPQRAFSYEYDANGNLSKVCYPDGNSASLTYDALNRLKNVKDWLGEYFMERNTEGAIKQVTDYRLEVTEYEYEKDGKKKWMRYPDGREVTFKWDAIGRVSRVESGSFFKDYGYDEQGRLIKNDMPNGLQSLYLYDGEGRLKELIHKKDETCLEHLIYGYGNAGEITTLSRICPEQEYAYSHTYEYDALGRITRVKGKEKEKEYRYDAYGNLMEDTNGEQDTVILNMDSLERVQTLLKDGTILQQNVYDSMGNRVEMRSKRDEENHRYTPDYATDNRHILMEQGEETNSYLWMGDTLLGIPSQNLYVLCDMQGTPLRVVEESGKSINRYRYGIYGEAEKIEEAKHLPFGFAGHVREEHPSYYYASAREYHASKGRFLSRDNLYYFKKTDPMGVNLYAYGKGNPLRYADYNGHESIQEYLTLEERLQRDGTDQLWRCIYAIDLDDLKHDIRNFDPKSSDQYITLGADIFSYGTGMRFLRYLSPEYIKRTANMVIKGNYCNDFTVLGLAVNIAIAITGFDIVQDLRDLSADFTVKFEPKKPEWWLSVGIDFLAVLPVIGLLKYLDETSTGFKSMKKAFVNSKEGIEDSIRNLLQNVPDNLKNIASIQDYTKHFNPLRKGVKETLEETGQKSDDLLENIQAIDKKVDIKHVAEEVGEGAGKLNLERINYYLSKASNNPSSKKAILGLTGIYDDIGQSMGYTYFKMTDELWNNLVSETAKNFDEVWKVNAKFIDDQIGAGKEIILSNDPSLKYLFDDGKPRFFQREIDYLIEKGYKFDKTTDGLWKAIKR